MNIVKSFLDLFRRQEIEKKEPFPDILVQDYDVGRGKVTPGDYKSYIEAYKGWVYKCVNKIASDVAAEELKLYTLNSDGEKEEIKQHKFLDTLKKPNPFTSKTEFIEKIQMFADLTGNSYIWIRENTLRIPQEFWIVLSQNIKVVPGKEVLVQGYIYDDGSGEKAAFDYNEIAHLRYPNPKSVFYGMSPLEAGIHDVNLRDYMDDYEDALYKNRARPDTILSTEQELSKEARDREAAEWNRLYRGSKKVGKVAVLSHGMKAEPFSMKPVDIEFMEGKRLTREEICSYFGIPILLMGIGKDAPNRSVAETVKAEYASGCIYPRLKRIANFFNFFIIPRYKSNKPLFVAYESPVPTNKEFLLKEREVNLRNYITVVNEERVKQGLEPVPWGDVPLAPISIMPLVAGGSSEGKQKTFSIPTAVRERKIRIHNIQTDKLEADYTKKLRKLMKSWIDRIQENMKKYGGKAIKTGPEYEDFFLIALGTMQEELWGMSQEEILRAIEMGWLQQMAETGVSIDFNPDYTSVIQHLQDRKLKIETVAEHYHDDIKGILREGFEEGKSVQEMAKDMEKWYMDTEKWKAQRVARTEMGCSRNGGEYYYAEECEQLKMKQWIHSHAANPREEHLAMEAMGPIPKNEPFIVGGYEMQYPRDYSGGPEEVINCRCTCIYLE